MTYQFVAYIDEAGDEGYNIVPPPEKKSSEWFLLSAVICGTGVDRYMHLMIDQSRPFHFRKADHHQRVAFAQRVAWMPIRAALVLAHKPSMPDDAAIRMRKHYLFDYSTKLLVERISWYCDENKGQHSGLVKIIFSNRRQLKRERIVAYLERLRRMSALYEDSPFAELARNSIRWNVIDPDLIDIQPHDSLPGLQVADAIVSGGYRAVELSPSQTTEHRYIKIMRQVFYRRYRKCLSYGIKFIPDELPDEDPFKPDRFHWLRHFR